MSVEVEIKLKIQDKTQVLASLEKLGFAKKKLVKETDIYYTAEHHDFAGLDEALRVRSIENLNTGEKTAAITYKGAKMDTVSMTRKELETEIGDAAVCREIFENIGFRPVPKVEKQRQYLQNGKITACVDTVTGLGEYLELEILAEKESERENALKELEELLQKIGYSIKDTTRKSYLSMMMGLSMPKSLEKKAI